MGTYLSLSEAEKPGSQYATRLFLLKKPLSQASKQILKFRILNFSRGFTCRSSIRTQSALLWEHIFSDMLAPYRCLHLCILWNQLIFTIYFTFLYWLVLIGFLHPQLAGEHLHSSRGEFQEQVSVKSGDLKLIPHWEGWGPGREHILHQHLPHP